MADFYARDIKRLDRDLAALEKVLDSLKQQALPRYIEAYVHQYLTEENPHDIPTAV